MDILGAPGASESTTAHIAIGKIFLISSPGFFFLDNLMPPAGACQL